MAEDCVFCDIVAGTAPAAIVHEDETTIAFMDIGQATRGHTLVIPKRHSVGLWDMPDDDAAAVMATTMKVSRMIRDSLASDGLNLWNATGRDALQTVFHCHVHLIPRYEGDGLVPLWTPGEPTDLATLRGLADQIRSSR